MQLYPSEPTGNPARLGVKETQVRARRRHLSLSSSLQDAGYLRGGVRGGDALLLFVL